ncbi:MAG: helix-turn-helix domain-containing protein, partial [Treponema sp.]|nr:helix-turn-helix domain-containing protein [Treponema sp.]
KIARLSYKTGYCWASNKFLDGTESGSTAKRQIKELIDAGYLKSVFDAKGTRKLYVCEINSKIEDDTPRPEIDTPQTKNGLPPDQKWSNPQTKNGLQTLQDITNINKQKKETEDQELIFSDLPVQEKPKPLEPPNEIKLASELDGTTLFNKAREYWNERKLKPECREIIMRPVYRDDVLRTMQHYTWEEIKNAIGNYAWHKMEAGPGYSDPPPYGSLYGFLKTGIERYFDDEALDQQFKKEVKS